MTASVGLSYYSQVLIGAVSKMLLSKGKITQDLVNMLMSWRHSGFFGLIDSGACRGAPDC